MTESNNSLDGRAAEIRAKWQEIDTVEDKASDMRIGLGKLLIETHAQVTEGGLRWEAWCRENIYGRSQRDIRRCMALARAPDAVAAREMEKAARRASDRRRAERTRSCPVTQDARAEALAAIEKAQPAPPAHVWNAGLSSKLPEHAAPAEQRSTLATIKALWPNLTSEEQGAFFAWTRQPAVGEAPAAQAVPSPPPPEQEWKPDQSSPDEGGLFAIWVDLKPNTKMRACWWIERGCPAASDPDEPLTITEALIPFRAAATKASEAQRQQFLAMTEIAGAAA